MEVAELERISAQCEKDPADDNQRLVIWRLMFNLWQASHAKMFPGKAFGQNADMMLTLAAARSLRIKGKKVTSSSLSRMLDLPRETARRRLCALKKSGLIEQAVDPDLIKYLGKLVKRAAKQLSTILLTAVSAAAPVGAHMKRESVSRPVHYGPGPAIDPRAVLAPPPWEPARVQAGSRPRTYIQVVIDAAAKELRVIIRKV